MAPRAKPPSDDAPGSAADEPRYRIGMVAKKTGIAAHTLRAWERRYGLASAGRMTGGGRLYSDREIARLKWLRLLTEQGHAISAVAGLSDDELLRLAAADTQAEVVRPERSSADDLRERFLTAIASYEVSTAVRVLSHAALVMPPRELVMELLGPLFEEIGARWESGEFSVAHEHAASAILRSELGTLLRGMVARPSERTIIACTLPHEQHEFGALLATLLAAALGYRVVYLGANLPVSDIVQAVRDVKASVVLVSLVNALDRVAKQELTHLADTLPRATALYVGGRAVEPELKWLKQSGIQSVRSLRELESLLAV